MARQSPVHYILPSAISVSPNANGSMNDLAVSVTRGARIKVFSQGISRLGWNGDNTYQEWTLSGRNRRLQYYDAPYTIYARLPKTDKARGYLVFAVKDRLEDGTWRDKYAYVTESGLSKDAAEVSSDYWYIRLGEVSLPDNDLRTVTLDTGILGTDQYNSEWNLDPDDMPLRVVLDCSIEGEDAGNTPYVEWAKSLILRASLIEGWEKDAASRLHHWTISRNTGIADADAAWPAEGRAAAFATSGNIALAHVRGSGDDFAGAVSTIFTVTAWGVKESDETDTEDGTASSDTGEDAAEEIVALASTSVTIMAETVEKMELELSRNIVNYNPQTDVYYPTDGIKVRIRAIDQKGNVFKLTMGQFVSADIAVQYALADSEDWVRLPYEGGETAVAEATLKEEIFHAQQNVNVRLVRLMEGDTGETIYSELTRQSIAFLRDGEDSKEREWIYLRSERQIEFGTADHPLPADIAGGEVEPEGAATGLDPDKQQEGWVPEGWWDDPKGTDDTYHYEYCAYRDYLHASEGAAEDGEGGDPDGTASDEEGGSRWSDFSEPRLWSYKGEDGVSYRCRWTLAGTEVWQLTAAYTGAFRGTLPLVATLMKRKGSEQEEEVAATAAIIKVSCEGIAYEKTVNADTPQFTISDIANRDFIDLLNDVALNGLSITFTIDGEDYHYSIPVIREADEDSIKRTLNEYGSERFLSKLYDDVAAGKITFQDLAAFVNGLKIGGLNSTYGISREAIATLIEIVSDNWTGDGQFDTGFRLTKNPANGITSLVVDNLMVRMKAVFSELEIRKISYSGGNIIFSHAGSRVVRVEAVYGDLVGMHFQDKRLIVSDALFGEGGSIAIPTAIHDGTRLKNTFEGMTLTAYRCYLLKDDGTTQTENWWHVGDQARCETFNIKEGVYDNVSNSFYWRLVTATGQTKLEDGMVYDYIDLSPTDCWMPTSDNGGMIEGVDLSDTARYISLPQAGDQLVQMGNRTDTARQGFVSIEVSGEYAPAFKVYQGINSYSLDGKRKICLSPRLTELKVNKLSIETEYDAQRIPMERGRWDDICERDGEGTVINRHRCYYYDLVQHGGSTWLCTYPESGIGGVPYTTEAPSETAAYWRIYAAKGEQGEQGKNITITGDEAVAHFATYADMAAARAAGTFNPDINDRVLLDSSEGYHESYDDESRDGEPRPTVMRYVSAPDFSWDIDFPSLLDGYLIDGCLWIAEETRWRNAGKWQGNDGAQGEDAVSVVLTPESIIVNQSLTTKAIDLSQAYADVAVLKGGTPQADYLVVLGTGEDAPVHCNATVSGSRVRITQIHTSGEQRYDHGAVTVKVLYGDSTYTRTLRFYCNLLGTWKETVEADTKEEVAKAISYAFDETGETVLPLQTIGTYIKSSRDYEVNLQQKVLDADGNIITAAGSLYRQTADSIEGTVTTKLGETGIRIDGTNRHIDLTAAQVIVSDGGERQTIVEGGKIKASLINAAEIVADGIKGKTIDAEDATFKNLLISGGVRSPFTHVAKGDRLDSQFNDNVVVISSGVAVFGLPWDVSQSGRKVVVTNYKWGTDTQAMTGYAQLQAPTGKYFFEDGIMKDNIQLSREVVELVGYGDNDEFYGWIVMSRINIATHYRYGHPLNVLAMGTLAVTTHGSPPTWELTGVTFDGSDLKSEWLSTGRWKISFDSEASWFYKVDYVTIMLTGFGSGESRQPVYANLESKTKDYFIVRTADDSSVSDGGFSFMVINAGDWMYLNMPKASASYNDGGGAWRDGGSIEIPVF